MPVPRALRVSALLAAVLLAVAIFLPAASSSAKQKDLEEAAGGTVPPVEASPPSPPEPPSARPPAPPGKPASVEPPPPPAAPPVETAPTAPPGRPAATPSPSQRPSVSVPGHVRNEGQARARPSPPGVTETIEGAAGEQNPPAVTGGPGAGNATGAKGAPGPKADRTAGPTPDPAGQSQNAHQSPISEAPAASVDQARGAPLPRWLAYVWPAFALERAPEEVLSALEEQLPAATRLPSVDLLRLLSPEPLTKQIAEASPLANVQPPAAGPQRREDGSALITLPSGAQVSALALILSCLALAALLAYAVKRELGSVRHRPF